MRLVLAVVELGISALDFSPVLSFHPMKRQKYVCILHQINLKMSSAAASAAASDDPFAGPSYFRAGFLQGRASRTSWRLPRTGAAVNDIATTLSIYCLTSFGNSLNSFKFKLSTSVQVMMIEVKLDFISFGSVFYRAFIGGNDNERLHQPS